MDKNSKQKEELARRLAEDITRLIQTAILRINYISPKVLQKLKEEILEESK